MVITLPVVTVTVAGAVKVKERIVTLEFTSTLPAGITTSVFISGTDPQLQLPASSQLPLMVPIQLLRKLSLTILL